MSQSLPHGIDKLDPTPLVQQGFQAFRDSEASPAELTIAVLAFHIAAEQCCRRILSQQSQFPPAELRLLWTESISWPMLVRHMQRYARLPQTMANTLHQLIVERNALCHRNPRYQGLREQVLQYGNVAEHLLYRLETGGWSSIAPGLNDLDELTLATLDAERERNQRQGEVALLSKLLGALPENING